MVWSKVKLVKEHIGHVLVIMLTCVHNFNA